MATKDDTNPMINILTESTAIVGAVSSVMLLLNGDSLM